MRTGTVSYKLEDLRKGVIIPIGMVGENDFTRVIFDAEEIFKKHPDAQVTMKVQPPKGGIYPATVTRDGNAVIWQVKAADVAHKGSGELQLTFTADTMVEKSYIAKTDIKRSLVGNGPAPDPVQDWLDEAQEALEDIESAEVHQPIIGEDGYWYTWNQETGEYEKTDTKAQGADGQPGQDGTDATPDLITKDYADLTFPVAEGTYCYHSGMLYYAKQDIQTSEAWTAAHWQQTTVEEQQRLLLNAIQGKMDEPETAGTEGQILALDESGNPEWVDPSTASIEDGAVTWPKLSQSVEEYIKITTESDTAANFNNLEEMTKLIVNGNSLAFGNVLLCDKRNILPSYPQYTRTHPTQPLTAVFNGRFVSVSGSNGSSGYPTLRPYVDWINVQDFEPGDYKLIAKQIADYTANETLYVNFEIKGTSGSKTLKSAYIGRTATSPSWDVTIDEGYTGDVSFNINVPPGFNGTTKLWFGLFKKPYTITDTEETVEDGETVDITIDPSDYANGIDSMQHKAIAEYHPAIQKYVDNLQINIDEELTYITPEAFGAVGNGVADDTTALQNCINYAITAGKVVRGFGIYKTTSSLTIDTDNSEIYLYCIAYEGNSYAVRIGGRYNLFTFGTIIATGSGAGCIELFTSTQSHHDTNRNVVRGISLESSGKCVFVNASSGYYILYNVFDVKSMASTASDCISSYGNIGELTIYNTWFRCPSGWCFNGGSVRFINCTMEANAYGGIYANAAVIQNCRARELMDALMPNNPNHGTCSGILFKQRASKTEYSTKIEIDDVVYYDSIDLSDALVLSSGDGAASANNAVFGVVNCSIVRGDLNYKYGMFTLGSKMLLHGKDKICIPQFKSKHHVKTTTCDLRDSNTGAGKAFYPTYFVIDEDLSSIYLSPSYCAEGYSEFVVDMSVYKTTIYDRRGNVLFNPSNYTLGVYKFTAIVDHTIDDTYQTVHTQTGQYEYPVNSGYCDVWEIEKVS